MRRLRKVYEIAGAVDGVSSYRWKVCLATAAVRSAAVRHFRFVGIPTFLADKTKARADFNTAPRLHDVGVFHPPDAAFLFALAVGQHRMLDLRPPAAMERSRLRGFGEITGRQKAGGVVAGGVVVELSVMIRRLPNSTESRLLDVVSKAPPHSFLGNGKAFEVVRSLEEVRPVQRSGRSRRWELPFATDPANRRRATASTLARRRPRQSVLARTNSVAFRFANRKADRTPSESLAKSNPIQEAFLEREAKIAKDGFLLLG